MITWISWLTQFWLGQLFLFLSLLWFGLGCWRWTVCRRRLSGLDLPPLLPPLLAVLAPFLLMQGFGAGWERLDKEVEHLNSLEVWDGLRAVEIVRHAINSFWTWSIPPASAGLMAVVCAVLLGTAHMVWSFDLFLNRRRKKPDELEEIRRELAEVKQLLMLQAMHKSPELPPGSYAQLPPPLSES
ncbi:MAG: hypothetical protein U0931_17780 [Vulcanimicrobiota bacterium]